MGNSIKRISLFVLMTSVIVSAAVIFEDDFSSQAVSDGKWLFNLSSVPAATVAVAGGSCTITNNSQFTALYSHPFSGTKPDVFTISFVIKSADVNAEAGLLFCRGNNFEGYFITLTNEDVIVFRMEGTSVVNIFQARSRFIESSNNEIKVSKKGSQFNVFVNGGFIGTFTDSRYASGDIGLLVHDGASAVFGAVTVTNEFTDASRTSFQDNFDGADLKREWRLSSNGAPEVKVENGKLRISTVPTGTSWVFVDLDVNGFTAKVEVSHVSGSNVQPYGIVLIGENPSAGGNTPMVHFGITGERKYWIVTSGIAEAVTPKDPLLGIKGSSGDRTDILEVKKAAGSNTYEFLVNGNVLVDDYPAAPFKIVAIGIFCYSELQVTFAEFSAADPNPTSIITWKPSQRPAVGSNKHFLPNNGQVFYDLRGRKRYTAGQTHSRGARAQSAGMYLNEQGREIRVRKMPQK
ncbi:MAG: hypothetical protein FWE57_02680 [Chitinispirillia bacterium]|nr:hypothetical protein [Chitinispirillia bacterium]